MSKKTRSRRGAPISKASANKSLASNLSSPSAPGRGEADQFVQQVLSSLWAGVESGDPLRAELETSTCMGLPYVLGQRGRGEIDSFISTVLIDGAVRREDPDGAAMLRVLMSLGTAGVKKGASDGLAQLTDHGVYPPEWVTGLGKVTPGQAWRRYDVFGDDEAIAATFGYGEAEHGVVVQVDLTGIPVATAVGVATDAASLVEAMTHDEDDFDRSEQISLAEARRRMEGPLFRCEREPDPALSTETIAYLPLARTRIRRLPADGQAAPEVTAADRAAAVDDFMKSPLAADAVAADEESTRFWAEVLTGYSSRIPGEQPVQVGPRKLAHILLGHVSNTFEVSVAQRQHLEPAVTAWTRWSAACRDLGEAETARLTEQLPDTFSRFDEAYAHPDAAAVRGYVSDLAASDADVSWLARHVGRRMFALPMPEQHHDLDQRNVGDPAQRRALTEAEFASCTPPAGLTHEQFVDAAYGVISDLWRADSDATFQAANRLAAEGVSRHDIIHRLAGAPAPTRAASIIT
ncbi:MAG: hypothetical protein M3Z75_05975 [Actinomycetota bacterium]|nr:hypothetical protein [Actinomycetota bacterium]